WDCPILNGLILNPGTYVIVANQPADNLGLGYTSSIFTEGTTWNQSTTLATGWANNETYNFLVSFLLRANFGEVVESTVGLDEVNSSEISIYPNPSSGNFNLNISNVNTASVDVEITDVSGKVILSNAYNTNNGSINESINISNVDDGVYIVRVNGGQSIVKRIVISNK
ncbi:MAG: T9SS type A sorting domain-containing protein, partial [Crocinitomicaceae bacterium]